MLNLITVVLGLSSITLASLPPDDLVQAGDLINGSFEQKTVKETGRTWDLAISGSGFFPLQDTKTGEMFYTRLGHFELDHTGYVILAEHPALRLILKVESRFEPLNMLKWTRVNGALMVGIAVDVDKEVGVVSGVYTNGEIENIATVVLAKFFNDGKLRRVEPNIYRAEAAALPSLLAPPLEKGLGGIRSNALEQL